MVEVGLTSNGGSAAINGRSENAHAAERVESIPLKIELILGSYEKSNSSIIEIILLRTRIELVHQACNCLTVLRGNSNHHHILTANFCKILCG